MLPHPYSAVCQLWSSNGLATRASINPPGICASALNFCEAYAAWLAGTPKNKKSRFPVSGAFSPQSSILALRQRYAFQRIATLADLKCGASKMADLSFTEIACFLSGVDAGCK